MVIQVLKVFSAASVAFATVLMTSAPIQAQDAVVERGRAFAQANCARCHAIGPVGYSPLPKAPPFRTLHRRYPVENLVEALAEGIRTAHPAMPEFELDQRQIDDLIAYLKSLEH
jgi:cytochrome c